MLAVLELCRRGTGRSRPGFLVVVSEAPVRITMQDWLPGAPYFACAPSSSARRIHNTWRVPFCLRLWQSSSSFSLYYTAFTSNVL